MIEVKRTKNGTSELSNKNAKPIKIGMTDKDQ